MKSDINKENDNLTRKGISAVYKETKAKKQRSKALEDPATMQQLKDWLFKNEGENPLKDIQG